MMSEISKAIDTVIRLGLAPRLKTAGFTKQGRTFRRSATGYVHVVNVQADRWNRGDEGRFTMNLGVYFPALVPLNTWPEAVAERPMEYDCQLRQRIGLLLPQAPDHWWHLDAATDLAALAEEAGATWDDYGAGWLAGITDLPSAQRDCLQRHEYYLAAAISLALDERETAATHLMRELENNPHPALLRWGTQHGLLPPT